MKDKLNADYLGGYGFAPETVIDVGVLKGTPFLYDCFPDAKFVLIDPLEESRQAVEATYGGRLDFDFHVCGASEQAGAFTLRVPRGGLAKSSTARRAKQSAEVEERQIDTRPLDDICAGYSGPFGLKIDTEGHELSVLRGARNVLKDCEFVIAEVSIKRRFENGYRFSDVIGFMAAEGFEAHSFLSGFTRSPRMSDVLFVKWNSPRFEMGKTR